MKRFMLLVILLLVGCSNKQVLNCSYVDYSNFYGVRKVVDVLTFEGDLPVEFNRNITLDMYDGVNGRMVYKGVKLEGKSFRKLVGGKYKINRNGNSVDLVLRTHNVNNLRYIGIIDGGYDDVKAYYLEIGFVCK